MYTNLIKLTNKPNVLLKTKWKTGTLYYSLLLFLLLTISLKKPYNLIKSSNHRHLYMTKSYLKLSYY